MAYNLAEKDSTGSSGHNCTVAINRFKKGPANYKSIIQSNKKYVDPEFSTCTDMLYQSDHSTGSFSWRDWSWVTYPRLSDKFPTNKLFGNSDFTNDIAQGNIANCYYMSGIYAYAEVDSRFQKLFAVKE